MRKCMIISVAVCVSALSIMSAEAPSQPVATTAPSTQPAPKGVSLKTMKRLIGVLHADAFVGIVTFESATVEGEQVVPPDKRKVRISLTGWMGLINDTGVDTKFRINGEFALRNLLAGKSPKVGKVDKLIEGMDPFPSGSTWVLERAEAHPLYPLAQAMSPNRRLASPDPGTRFLFLAVGPSDPEKSILDYTLVGPFADNELADAEKAVKWYLELKAEASDDDVRGAIDSGSPATVMLAMARLGKDAKLKPADYAHAIGSVPAEYMEDLVVALLNSPTSDTDAGAALRDEIGQLSPTRRSQVLNAISKLAKEGGGRNQALAQSVQDSPTTKPKE